MIQIVSRFSGFLELSLVVDFLFLFMFFLFFLVPYCIQPVYLSMMLNLTLLILFGLVGLSPYIPATFFFFFFGGGGGGWGGGGRRSVVVGASCSQPCVSNML